MGSGRAASSRLTLLFTITDHLVVATDLVSDWKRLRSPYLTILED